MLDVMISKKTYTLKHKSMNHKQIMSYVMAELKRRGLIDENYKPTEKTKKDVQS